MYINEIITSETRNISDYQISWSETASPNWYNLRAVKKGR